MTTIKPNPTAEPAPASKIAGEFLGRLLYARTQGHVYHLQCTSGVDHLWLDEFYKGIGKVFDKIAELYQGATNTIVRGYYYPPCREDSNPVAYLKELQKYIATNRYDFVPRENTNIQANIDNALDLICTALYKLQKLK